MLVAVAVLVLEQLLQVVWAVAAMALDSQVLQILAAVVVAEMPTAVLVVQALLSLDTWRKGKIQWHILQR
jgi:hypothetical protein